MKEINLKLTSYVLGLLLLVEAGFLSLSTLVSFLYKEEDLHSFLFSVGVSIVLGSILIFAGRGYSQDIGKREGFLIVTLTWILYSLVGTIPFVLSGSIPSFTNAFFETISGFTGTGASILNNIEELPHGILFWRSITQWMGGMGMVVFTIALIPLLNLTGGCVLYNTESPGLTKDKMTPQVTDTARRLWFMYLALTIIQVLLLLLGPMNLFEAICHSFTAMGTGGYSTKQSSIAAFNSPYTEYILTIFCFIAGINFSLLFLILFGKVKKAIFNDEFKWYFGFAVVATILTMYGLIHKGIYTNFEEAFRYALFQVVTLMTTCGYATGDYVAWGSYFGFIFTLLMIVGGSAGSTSGGVKTIRIVVMIKNMFNEFRKQLHPSALVPVKLNHQVVPNPYVVKTLAFIFVYLCVVSIGSVVLTYEGCTFDEAIGSVVSCISGVGPGLGRSGPAGNYDFMSSISKWTLSAVMLVGRLELFTVLILFTPAFWFNR
ncbi:MAG: TrkH family potassium uptake protein [Bacteroidales bacterium]